MSGGSYPTKHLGDGVLLVSGQHVPAAEVHRDHKGVPYLTGPSQFRNDGPMTSLSTTHPRAMCEPGDILLTVKGSGTGTMVIADREYAISRQLMAIRPYGWDPLYVYAQLTRRVDELRRKASGIIPGITRGDVLRTLVPAPPIGSQRVVASLFVTYQQCDGLLNRLLQTKRRLKRGLMQQLLTGKRRFKEFEKEPWTTQRVGALFEVVSRPVEWDDSAAYDLLSIRRRSGGVFHRSRTEGKKIKTKQLFQVRAGDFLISRMQVVHGALGLVRPEFDGMHVSGSYVVLRNKNPDGIRAEFFDQLTRLQSMYRQALLASYGVHIEKMTFNLEWYLKAEILVPSSLGEQDAIVGTLTAMDRDMTAFERLQAALDRQRHGVMELLLTGKVLIPA